MLYGYARLPWMNYNESILSAGKPVVDKDKVLIEVENFGQVSSKEAILTLYGYDENGLTEWCSTTLLPIKPYKTCQVEFKLPTKALGTAEDPVVVKITSSSGHSEIFHTFISR